MQLIDIIIAVACSLIVLSVVVIAIINKMKGKTSCGCDCANCSGCKSCKNKTSKQNTANK
ncbi:MAG: hypothetical protein IKA11_03785 [Clostridia bacterium]|nr:hypothetical protein [Clostridia bacterium]